MQPTIRTARPQDRRPVEELAERLSEGVAPWRDPDAVRRAGAEWALTSLDEGAAFVAIADETVVGFISLSSTQHFTQETDGYIGELMVAPPFEGRGIGGALVEAAERAARGRGYRCLTLTTGAANHRALQFYERRGFVAEDVTLTKLLDESSSSSGRSPREET